MAEPGAERTARRAVQRAEAVLDLRNEPLARHRPTRGVPREPDAHLRAYRDRPAHPDPRTVGDPARVLDVTAALAVDQPDQTRADDDISARPSGKPPSLTPAAPATPARPSEVTAGDHLVVRRLRLRSVAKVALAFYLCLLGVLLVAGLILWNLADRAGWVTNWTGFLVDLGFSDASVDGGALLRASAMAGGVLAVTGTVLTVAAAVFYNQLSGLIGGIEVSLHTPRRLARRRAGT